MASRHKFRTKGCMDEYKDKYEKDKPMKKNSQRTWKDIIENM